MLRKWNRLITPFYDRFSAPNRGEVSNLSQDVFVFMSLSFLWNGIWVENSWLSLLATALAARTASKAVSWPESVELARIPGTAFF